jgi:hypothetical protein
MSLRIGFDVDGVFADMDSALRDHAESLFPRARTASSSVSPDEGSTQDAAVPDGNDEGIRSRIADLTPRQQHQLWKHVATVEGFWESMSEIEPGTTARVAELAAKWSWEVIFLTKRPRSAGVTSQVQTQRWLAARGFPHPSVFVVQRSRGLIASALALDVVIDDRAENCLDVVAESGARAVLVWRDDPSHVPELVRRSSIRIVGSLAECLDILADASAPHRPGLIARLTKSLGLERKIRSPRHLTTGKKPSQ